MFSSLVDFASHARNALSAAPNDGDGANPLFGASRPFSPAPATLPSRCSSGAARRKQAQPPHDRIEHRMTPIPVESRRAKLVDRRLW
jgi:hypothetical protein